MAATVAVVQTTAAGAGAPVAVDVVGTTAFQQVKLVGGSAGVTAPIEATTAAADFAAVALVVRQAGTANVTIVGAPDNLSVTLAAVGPSIFVPVGGRVMNSAGVEGGHSEVNVMVTKPNAIARGFVVRHVGTAEVTGTVEVSGTVTIAPTVLTVNTAATVAGASVTAQVSGTVTISPTILTVNTAPTVAGASVTIQQGASVSAVVSGTVSLLNVVPVTTAASVSVTGLPVWLNPTQGVNANLVAAATTIPVNIVAGGSQTTVVSGTVAISIPVSQTVGTIVAVSGVTAVSVVSTVVTILGTQIVTLATGATVTLVGTVGVSVIAAVSLSGIVPVTTQASVSVTGLPVWWHPSATIQVSGVVAAVTTQSSATGAAIWLCPTQTINIGSSVVVIGQAGQVVMTVTSTSVIATSTTQFMLMTVNFDQYTQTALVSGYSIRRPMAVTGITVVYSGTSVTVPSVMFAVYATTSGISLTSAGAMIMWSTIFPTMTGAAVSTTLNFPATIMFPANGVMGLAVYRIASSTVTCNIGFTIVGQYLN